MKYLLQLSLFERLERQTNSVQLIHTVTNVFNTASFVILYQNPVHRLTVEIMKRLVLTAWFNLDCTHILDSAQYMLRAELQILNILINSWLYWKVISACMYVCLFVSHGFKLFLNLELFIFEMLRASDKGHSSCRETIKRINYTIQFK